MTSYIKYLIPAGLILLLCLSGCTTKKQEAFSEQEWARTVEQTRQVDLYASNRKDGRYFTPWIDVPDKSFLDVLIWKLFGAGKYTPEEKNFLPGVIPETAKRIQKTTGDFILWIGHNTFLVRIKDTYWITDPMFSKRALLPARLTPPAITIEELNRLVESPNILITHNHYDHLDSASVKKLPADSKVFAPMGMKKKIKGWNKTDVTEMDWFQETTLGYGVKLICLPTQHWSLRINQGRNTALWVSWLLITPETTLYFGGDTGYFKGFREFGKKYPGIDYAFMATTAYHPRWFMHHQHMNIEEAVRGFDEIGARFFIPTQWGTFPLGQEPAGYPGLDLARYIKKNKQDLSRFKIMNIGEIIPIEP